MKAEVLSEVPATHAELIEAMTQKIENDGPSKCGGSFVLVGTQDPGERPQSWIEGFDDFVNWLRSKGFDESADHLTEFRKPFTMPIFAMLPGGDAIVSGVTLTRVTKGGAA